MTAGPARPRSAVAVVLAAGASRRMGRPKALLPWGAATTVLGRVIEHAAASRAAGVVVVTGDHAAEVGAVARSHGAAVVHNPAWRTGGLTGSLQAALRSVAPSASAVAVLLGDQPLIGPAVIDAVIAAHVDDGSDLVAAASGGRRGHPVLFGRRYFDALLAEPPDGAPRAVLDRFADSLRLVDAGSDAVVVDIDTPEDYARLREESG